VAHYESMSFIEFQQPFPDDDFYYRSSRGLLQCTNSNMHKFKLSLSNILDSRNNYAQNQNPAIQVVLGHLFMFSRQKRHISNH
jgi:hypothetical protein